jgi:hypothetical protein
LNVWDRHSIFRSGVGMGWSSQVGGDIRLCSRDRQQV